MLSPADSLELFICPKIPELVRLVRAVADLASLEKVVAGRRRGGAPIITFNTFLIYFIHFSTDGSLGAGKQAVLLRQIRPNVK